MAYVDLNPIRACMAETPETSDHTSIKERIAPQFNITKAIKTATPSTCFDLPIKPLLHFDGNLTSEEQHGIPFSLSDYLTLVDWTGRIIREDKRGSIAQTLPPILERLSINNTQWIKNSTQFETRFQKQFQKRRQKTS